MYIAATHPVHIHHTDTDVRLCDDSIIYIWRWLKQKFCISLRTLPWQPVQIFYFSSHIQYWMDENNWIILKMAHTSIVWLMAWFGAFLFQSYTRISLKNVNCMKKKKIRLLILIRTEIQVLHTYTHTHTGGKHTIIWTSNHKSTENMHKMETSNDSHKRKTYQ